MLCNSHPITQVGALPSSDTLPGVTPPTIPAHLRWSAAFCSSFLLDPLPPDVQVERSPMQLILPMTNDLSRPVATGARDFPQCDATVCELMRAMVKVRSFSSLPHPHP